MQLIESFFPEAASEIGPSVDTLVFALLIFSLIIFFAVFGSIVYFGWKYREGSNADRAGWRSESLKLEIGSLVAAVIISLIFFVWAGRVYLRMTGPGEDAEPLEILVEAKQWMWKFEHPTGKREINELHLPLGRQVRLLMHSKDVIHSLFVPEFRIKHDVLPDRISKLNFVTTKTGTFQLECSQYCGTEHSRMRGTVVVTTPEEYALWAGAAVRAGPAAEGERLFRQYACHSCHGSVDGPGPPLAMLYGRARRMEDGKTVVVDDDYVRESIDEPQTKVVAGYGPTSIMPSYKGRVLGAEMLQLIAYIKSLSREGHPQAAPEGQLDQGAAHDNGR